MPEIAHTPELICYIYGQLESYEMHIFVLMADYYGDNNELLALTIMHCVSLNPKTETTIVRESLQVLYLIVTDNNNNVNN